MQHQFKISVEAAARPGAAPLTFDVASHDDFLTIIERVRRTNIVPWDDAPAFAVGLKLLADVLIRHRDEPQLAELTAAVVSFIKRLKTLPAAP